jgi:RNA polymerase sigma factor (sigma-70 family)
LAELAGTAVRLPQDAGARGDLEPARPGRNPHQVDELAAETWARVVRGVQAPGFDPTRDFASWVCAVAAKVCREYFRREQRAVTPRALPPSEDLQDPDDYRQAQALLELHRALAECLDGLSREERKVYELRFEQGLSGPATAEALGVPESTFREKLLPALFGKLAHGLADRGFEEALALFSTHRDPISQKGSERRMA